DQTRLQGDWSSDVCSSDLGGTNHSVRVKLVGTKSNRDGIGAVVHVTSSGAKQWQMLRSGSSYLSQSELVLTFGLGASTKADAIRSEERRVGKEWRARGGVE